MPRVTVVIPTWNGRDLLAHALGSLDRQRWRDFETIVVDNGSADGTMEMLTRCHTAIRWVRFEENRGFAVAANAGIRAARGEIIVLMNNDTEADPGWLEALVRVLDAHEEVGCCASKMLNFLERDRIDAAGDQMGIVASQIGHGELDGPAFSQPRYVLSPCAGAAAYRRSVLDQVGLFDERFFAYLEDVDLGIRIQFAGFQCLYVPDAVIYHQGSATARRIAGTKFYLLMRNSLIIFYQYMPPFRMLLGTPFILALPFVASVRYRQPIRLAFRAFVAFVWEIPEIVRRRSRLVRTGRITWAEFRRRLAGPLTRQRVRSQIPKS